MLHKHYSLIRISLLPFTAGLIAVVIIGGYQVIYPSAFDFATSRPTISANEREVMARYFTLLAQALIVFFLCCCHRSLTLLAKSVVNGNRFAVLPIVYGLSVCFCTYCLLIVMF